MQEQTDRRAGYVRLAFAAYWEARKHHDRCDSMSMAVEAIRPVIEADAIAAQPLRDAPEGLKEFARTIIRESCFEGTNIVDGGDVQELAVKHGLLKQVAFDPAVHSDRNGDAEAGDPWYLFTALLLPSPSEPKEDKSR